MVQPGRTISTSDTSGKAVKPGRSDRNEGLVQPGSTDNTSDGSGKIAKPGRSERNEGMVQSGRTGNTADAAGKVVRPGRNDRHEGMTQSDRTGQTAGSSGNVVKAVRSEPNDGRAETATRAIEQIHSGNRQSESRAGQEEKPTPAKDRRAEQNTTMSDVQLQGLAVRLFGDLQAKLSSFVQSIKDSARRAQPDQAAPNEIAGEQRNVSMLPKPSDIRLKGPGAPAESTTAYTYARPADKDATDALIAFVKANRSLLDGVL